MRLAGEIGVRGMDVLRDQFATRLLERDDFHQAVHAARTGGEIEGRAINATGIEATGSVDRRNLNRTCRQSARKVELVGLERFGNGRRTLKREGLARPVVDCNGALARHRGIARGEVERGQIAVRDGEVAQLDAVSRRDERTRQIGLDVHREVALARIGSLEGERIRGEGTVVGDVGIVRNRHALGRERTRLIDVSVDRERINVGSTRIRERAVNRGRGDIERLAVMDERAVHIKRITRPGTGVRQIDGFA